MGTESTKMWAVFENSDNNLAARINQNEGIACEVVRGII